MPQVGGHIVAQELRKVIERQVKVTEAARAAAEQAGQAAGGTPPAELAPPDRPSPEVPAQPGTSTVAGG